MKLISLPWLEKRQVSLKIFLTVLSWLLSKLKFTKHVCKFNSSFISRNIHYTRITALSSLKSGTFFPQLWRTCQNHEKFYVNHKLLWEITSRRSLDDQTCKWRNLAEPHDWSRTTADCKSPECTNTRCPLNLRQERSAARQIANIKVDAIKISL